MIMEMIAKKQQMPHRPEKDKVIELFFKEISDMDHPPRWYHFGTPIYSSHLHPKQCHPLIIDQQLDSFPCIHVEKR